MKAVVFDEPGGAEVLQVREVPMPEVREGEVLIRVAATALNRADIMQRLGSYPPPKGASPILGLECSGTVESVGSHVTRWKVGDQVCALLAGGGYAEYVSVPESQILPVPDGVPLVDAAALPEAACTVWSTVFMMAKLQPGESFLVHGGSSGIGTFAIQLAKLLESRVFCTAGSTEKLDRCRQLGANVTINYRKEDFLARVKEETSGKGVNVILDNMGASYMEKNLSCLAEDGRMVVIGLQGGRIGSVDLGRMLMKRLSLHSAGLRSRPLDQKTEIVREVGANVWPLISSGQLKPIIFQELPMADVQVAHALMESSVHIGKIVLIP
ncbi:unnamed protein product [Closterium sp. Yama58-4]|nr:unnamed protein product [Closterium sp. Yama58-4]